MRTAPLFVTLALFALAAHASVGVVSALKGRGFVDRQGKTTAAAVGTELMRRDTVRTAEASRMQLLFADRTVVTLGPSSRLVVESYLYDGRNSEADLSMTRGFFRSVTGKIGKVAPKRFKLRTANATIGIRGTEIVIHADPVGGDTIACVRGAIVVTAHATRESVEVPAGFAVVVKPGKPLSKPKEMDDEAMEELAKESGGKQHAKEAAFWYKGNAYDARTQKRVAEEAEEDLFEPVEVYDYDYVSLGFTRNGEGQAVGTWIQGKEPTSAQTIRDYKRDRVTASYRGGISAIADGKAANGRMNMHFDFGKESFHGTLDFRAQEGGPRWIVYMKGEGSERFKNDGTFNTEDVGNANGTDITIQRGRVEGAFYGPGAQNIGGTFSLEGAGGHTAHGHFGGER